MWLVICLPQFSESVDWLYITGQNIKILFLKYNWQPPPLIIGLIHWLKINIELFQSNVISHFINKYFFPFFFIFCNILWCFSFKPSQKTYTFIPCATNIEIVAYCKHEFHFIFFYYCHSCYPISISIRCRAQNFEYDFYC